MNRAAKIIDQLCEAKVKFKSGGHNVCPRCGNKLYKAADLGDVECTNCGTLYRRTKRRTAKQIDLHATIDRLLNNSRRIK
jgi:uncharacterized Zn finger protein (UPF0148 family)